MTALLLTTILHGLILGLVTFGVMIPFKILDCPDLTPEASYTFGGCLSALLMMLGISSILSLLITSFCCGIIGLITATVYLRFKINSLLAGIIVSTMLYSVNLRMLGKPNAALFDLDLLLQTSPISLKIIGMIMLMTTVISLLYAFLKTEHGLKLRAVGLNPSFCSRTHISVQSHTQLGFFIGNACAGLAGCITIQLQSYADVNMGTGFIIHALAALMIGEAIVGKKTTLTLLISPFIGAMIYQHIQSLVLLAGLAPGDLKILTGLILIVLLMLRSR